MSSILSMSCQSASKSSRLQLKLVTDFTRDVRRPVVARCCDVSGICDTITGAIVAGLYTTDFGLGLLGLTLTLSPCLGYLGISQADISSLLRLFSWGVDEYMAPSLRDKVLNVRLKALRRFSFDVHGAHVSLLESPGMLPLPVNFLSDAEVDDLGLILGAGWTNGLIASAGRPFLSNVVGPKLRRSSK